MQFYGFAFICTAGAKRDQKWGIIAIETESRFAESGASRGFNLVANYKKQVDKCKNRPLAANSNLGGKFVQFSLQKQIQRFVNWRGYCEVSEGGAS